MNDPQGQKTDLNLFDAILLNATRIGHGYAITKHPNAKKLAVERNIALEVCPISNQVLKLVEDIRNHPIVELIQDGDFPLVIAPDDPGLYIITYTRVVGRCEFPAKKYLNW